MEAEVNDIVTVEGRKYRVKVNDRELARFVNEDDAKMWCRLWNTAEDPNGFLERCLEGFGEVA